jgi:hypothetical protein
MPRNKCALAPRLCDTLYTASPVTEWIANLGPASVLAAGAQPYVMFASVSSFKLALGRWENERFCHSYTHIPRAQERL